MNMVLSLQTLDVDSTQAAGNSGASVACTSGSAVSYNCGGGATKQLQF